MLIISFISSQVNESDIDKQHYGDCAMDFIAGEEAKFWQWDDFCSFLQTPAHRFLCDLSLLSDTTAAGDSCLSELLPFQGCVIPPLTPQRDFSEDSMVQSTTEKTENGVPWRSVAECQGRAHGDSMAINKQVKHNIRIICVPADLTQLYVMQMTKQNLSFSWTKYLINISTIYKEN